MSLIIHDETKRLVHKRSERVKPIRMIVTHATAGASAISSILWLQNGMRNGKPVKASYDYIISGRTRPRDPAHLARDPKPGIVFKLVPSSTHCSWHSGAPSASGPLGAGVNQYSIGISFACKDDGIDTIHPDAEEAAIELIIQLVKAYPTIEYISTHYLTDPTRKQDPYRWDFAAFFTRLNARPELQGRTLRPWRPATINKWNRGIEG